MRGPRRGPTTLVLSVTCLILTAMCAAIVGIPEPAVDTVSGPEQKAAASIAPSDGFISPSSVGNYSSIWLKPLFWESRSPDSGSTGVGAQASGLTLTGVVITPGLRVALFKRTDNKTVAGKPGQALPNGWTVIGIEPRTVDLARETEHLTLTLPRAHATASPSQDGPPTNGPKAEFQ